MNRAFAKTRRTLLKFCAGLAVIPAIAAAADKTTAYPDKAVTIITAFSIGSGPDVVLRMVAEQLSRQWKQPVIVENRPGGAGTIAIELARRAKPDGYTLLQVDSEQIGALPHLYPSRKLVPLQDFDFVAALFRTSFFVAVATGSEWKDMKQIIADAKTNPGHISYGSWGVGSPGDLGGQQLEALSEVKMLHIPYKEVAQLYTNLGSKEIDWAFASIASSMNTYQSGKIRYLAIAAKQRHPNWPDIPTIAESGGPEGLFVDSFAALLAPKGTPPQLITILNEAVRKATTHEKVQTNFDAFAFETLDWSPQEVRKQGEMKNELYGELIRQGSIKLD